MINKLGTKACDPMVFNHPAVKKFLESPSRSSSPANQGSESLSVNHSESESSQHTDYLMGKDNGNLDAEERLPHKLSQRLNKNSSQVKWEQGVKLRYIPPDKREENDQSTHKWMVYVRGSRREPSIDHFVKKVWFFLHPSYKPNDLVEVREPPFHLTRRGWGEFPVRVQIHFKDSRNKRIDIIHHLKLDRTYTGLQTLGAETVVDVELHRHSLREEYLFSHSSDSDLSDASNSLPLPLKMPAPVKSSSPIKQIHEPIADAFAEKGFSTETDRHTAFYSLPSSLERTPTKLATPKVTFGSHGNSAFQPIAASCKIIPQGRIPSPAESPGKSFQPITMSCKIVSGSPISTPSPSPLPRTPTTTPVHMKQGTTTPVVNNPYVIVDKHAQTVGVVAANTGSPASKVTNVSQASHGTGSPVSKIHGSSFVTSTIKQEDSLFATMPPLCPIGSHSKVQNPKSVTGGPGTFTKVIIKQEPGELPQQTPVPATGTVSQAPVQQYVTVKGGHMITLSPQKQIVSTGEGSASSKIVSVPVGSALPASVKQAVAIGGGQILVAKSGPSVAKTVGGKQVLTQGVAKAIVSSGGGTIVAQPVQTLTKAQVPSTGVPKSGPQGSVMATLQLPATNLANLANLPPGTKLYLTTNSKNPSGKGKLLLIPQGAILRATNNPSQQSGSSASGGGGTQSTSTGLSQHLTYTSYILKQTPQGTFLVGQPSHQSSAKQAASGTVVQGSASAGTSSSQGHQALKVLTGPKTAALFAQSFITEKAQHYKVVSLIKRIGNEVIEAASSGQASLMKISDNTLKSLPASSQLSKPGTTVLRVSGGVITAATTPAVTLPSNGVAKPVDSAGSNSSPAAGPVVKASGQQHQGPVSHGQTASAVPNKTSASAVVSIASWVTAPASASGKTAVSGVLKIHSSQNSPQQAVLTVPSQLKQLGVSAAPGGVQTILMPVNKVIQSLSSSKVSAVTPVTSANAAVPSTTTVSVAKVKVEPDSSGQSCSALVSQDGAVSVKAEESSELGNYVIGTKRLLIHIPAEDSNSFCASSVEQYYSWNIGKRRASEWQRALTIRKLLHEIIEKNPKFHSISPLKTKQVVQWCRSHGYTPPDPETFRSEDSIEDVLTQIDSEPECLSTYTTGKELCRKLDELERFLKQEPDNDEEVDILSITNPLKINIKKEQEEKQEEEKFYLAPQPASEFVRETVQQVGISLQPVELHKNICASVIEDMILKATEQLASDILRKALAIGYQAAPRNRSPREITVMNIHQAICNIPYLDFLTNKHMGILSDEQ
ncbi:hypothetical protein JD844_007034 [Phrynosoma platyrhinos]|uniref:YEATS domain-containing protein n=1 Tax=Phrynosoma platyrhinos TaxID=52577 RepID=A0ABQ7T2T2_PHRPL|nr:hypothetical protein JD844_007034 [Phrynosoma platyrhinos]